MENPSILGTPDAFYKSPVDNSNYDSLTPKYTPKVLLLEMIYIYLYSTILHFPGIPNIISFVECDDIWNST